MPYFFWNASISAPYPHQSCGNAIVVNCPSCFAAVTSASDGAADTAPLLPAPSAVAVEIERKRPAQLRFIVIDVPERKVVR